MAFDRSESEEIGNVDPEKLPTADITVESHIHYAMAGSFPLQIAELFFTAEGFYIAEYSYITPLFGLGTGKHNKDANAMQAMLDQYGIDAVLLHADHVVWLNYVQIDKIMLYSGGWIGRPKITIYTADHQSYAYRLFGDREFDAIVEDVSATAEKYDMEVAERNVFGFKPRENLKRFFS